MWKRVIAELEKFSHPYQRTGDMLNFQKRQGQGKRKQTVESDWEESKRGGEEKEEKRKRERGAGGRKGMRLMRERRGRGLRTEGHTCD